MIQVGTTEAFAIYDAACLAEDLDTATDIESERRWDAGRNAFRATVETSADALMLIARLRSSGDLSFKAGRSLAVIIKRGVTSADLPALRQQIAYLRNTALTDNTDGFCLDQLIDGLIALSAFLFLPRLIPVIAR